MMRARLITAAAAAAQLALAAAGSMAAASPVTPPRTLAFGTRITASQTPATLAPGATHRTLLVVTVANEALPLGPTRTLRALRVANTTAGPGTIAERDAELGVLRLHEDLAPTGWDAGDPLLSTAAATSGAALFDSLAVAVAPGQSRRLLVVADVPLVARDGDALDLAIQSAADVTVDNAGGYENAFPVAPAGSFPINGMVAAQIGLGPLPAAVAAGESEALVLDVVVPANGYAADQLQQLTLLQTGTAVHGVDFHALTVRADDGDGVYEPAADRLVGAAGYTGGNRWQLTALAEPIPAGGLRLWVSATIAADAAEGRTLRFQIPAAPEAGFTVASANDGPHDAPATGPSRAVSTADRVRLAAAPLAPVAVRADARDAILIDLVLENRYGSARTLERLTVTNAGRGGTTEDRDRTVESLTLRLDGDGDGALGDSLADPPLASAHFTVARAAFTLAGFALPAGATRRVFVTARLAPAAATDGDTLSAVLEAPDDAGFAEPTALAAAWPLDSRARVAIDGMVASQLGLAAAPGVALAPADSHVLALDVTVPRNGRADDALHGVTLVNLGSAGPGDLAAIRLWRDDGDGAFAPATDLDLGPASWNGSAWVSQPLDEALGGAGLRLFAAVTLAAAPQDSATVQLAIPVGGLAVASGNDGPLDRPVAQPHPLVVSNSPLLAALGAAPEASAVGQTVTLRMILRNAGPDPLAGVAPSALALGGAGTLTIEGGPAPATVDLAPGASDTLVWIARAASAGAVEIRGSAQGATVPSGDPRRSLETAAAHEVFAVAGGFDLALPVSLPAVAVRGQSGIVPLTFRITHPGEPGTGALRITALRAALDDGGGAAVAPAALLAGVTVTRGGAELLRRTALEPAGGELDLTLATPVTLEAGETADLAVGFAILDTTAVPAFRVRVEDGSWIAAADALSGAPAVPTLAGGSFPVMTGVAQVVSEAERLDVTAPPAAPRTTGPSATDVPLLGLRLVSPGSGGITSDVRVSALAVDVSDSNGVPLPLIADVLSRIRVRSAAQLHAVRALAPGDGGAATLVLSPPVTVPVNTPLDLAVSGDVAPGAAAGAFRLRLADSTRFDSRDAGTRDRVAPRFASDPLPGAVVTIESRAESLGVRGTPRLPAAVRAGDPRVPALAVTLRHPGGAAVARVRLDTLALVVRDEARRPLAPAAVLDHLRIHGPGGIAGEVSDPPATGDVVAVPLAGVTVAPGDTLRLEVEADFAATAPEGWLELLALGEGVRAVDHNLGTRAAVFADSGELPLGSGLTRIQAPARTLTVALASRMPAALAADGREVAAAVIELANPAAAGAGAIEVDRLTLRAADRAGTALVLGGPVAALTAAVDGVPWAAAAVAPGDTAVALAGAAPIAIGPGAAARVTIAFTARAGAGGSLRLGLDAAGVGVVQPPSAVLRITVLPAAGTAFPLWSESGSFGALDLARGFSNFPNPFAAGREATTFAYPLERAARVWLRLLTLDGEVVRTIAAGATRGAGVRQEDGWDGRNGAGRVVRNGVYLAELVVRWEGGGEARALRKVAVVR